MSLHKAAAGGLVLSVGVFATAAAADGPLPFGDREIVDALGDNPRTVIPADVDGDGDVDLVVATLADNTVAWHENSGGPNPTFTKQIIDGNARGAREVWVDDVNGDGRMDVLAASRADDTLQWYENMGGSPVSFTHRIVSDQVIGSWSVYSADVDGDGDVDLLSAGRDDDKISWHENDGASPPNWTRHVVDTGANRAQKAFAADVDGDGDIDLLSASGASGELAWYENDGASDPSFTKHSLTTSLNNTKWVWTGDLNNDGHTDILGVAEGSSVVEWWENSGGPSPTLTQRSVGAISGAKMAVPVDLDLDGDTDVLACGIGLDETVFFENTGGDPVQWARHVITNESDNPLTVFPGDLDGDGDPDIAVASFMDSTVGWYENRSVHRSVRFEDNLNRQSGGNAPEAFARADIDDDGDLDVFVGSSVGGAVRWLENTGDPNENWPSPVATDMAAGVGDVRAADLDGDGDMDALAAAPDTNEAIWLRNDGGDPIAFTRLVIGGAPSVRALAPADFDGDGDLDVVTVDDGDGAVIVHSNDGASSPSFTPTTVASDLTSPRDLEVGDFNHDGRPDVAVAVRDENTIALFINQGGSPPSFSRTDVPFSINDVRTLEVGDVNGDGALDIVTGSFIDGTVTLLENDGGASFTMTELTDAVPNMRALSVDDADLDGDLDVLAIARNDGEAFLLENRLGEGGGFEQRLIGQNYARPLGAIFVQLFGDAAPEVLVASTNVNQVRVLANRTGHYELESADASPESIPEGAEAAALSVSLGHLGREGDAGAVLREIAVGARDGSGMPLSPSAASEVIASLAVYRDDGSMGFEPESDELLVSDESPAFDGDGVATLSFSGGAPATPEEGALYWIAVRPTDTAADAAPDGFALALAPGSEVVRDEVVDGLLDPAETQYAQTGAIMIEAVDPPGVIGTPWRAHTIDDSLLGAESVQMMDLNDDGLTDLVAGWEQSNDVRVYLHPGHDLVTGPWPSFSVGGAPGVERATPVDLDGDGRVDVVSALQLNNGVVRVHWAPPKGTPYDSAADWTWEDFPAPPAERWTVVRAMDVDGQNGPDLVIGAVGQAGDWDVPIGWLRSPADPRDVSAWTYHALGDAALVSAILSRDMDGDGDNDVVWTNRLFQSNERGAWWLENPGDGPTITDPWTLHPIGSQGQMAMALGMGDVDQDGLEDVVVPDREFALRWHRRQDATGLSWTDHQITWFENMGRPKSATVGDVDLDGDPDIVVSAVEATKSEGVVGVAWFERPDDPFLPDWRGFNISGGGGEKFDLVRLLDVDGDGDLDVVTTEERNNSQVPGLGVVWYENPTIEGDGDVNRDGVTGFHDLGLLLNNWGQTGDDRIADLDNSGVVNAFDLAILINAWGRADLDAEE